MGSMPGKGRMLRSRTLPKPCHEDKKKEAMKEGGRQTWYMSGVRESIMEGVIVGILRLSYIVIGSPECTSNALIVAPRGFDSSPQVKFVSVPLPLKTLQLALTTKESKLTKY